MEHRIKMVDSRGRLTLGPRFAGREVIVRELPDATVVVELARAIPEREGWLYDNADALGAVRRGLSQAREGRVRPLDTDALLAVADQCEDE